MNCAALAPALIASELFGHERGAFTGALQRRIGRFEMADGGTIFLDEVGDLPLDTQVALLRVLQEREFERVGGAQTVRVDVRVITATNRDLTAAVANGSFREDLFYRLNVFPIEVPPLRARADDLLLLVEYFVQRYASRTGRHVSSIDRKTLELLQRYDWPGNIRELQNVIERSVIVGAGEVFAVDPAWLTTPTAQPRPRVAAPAPRGEAHSEREIDRSGAGRQQGPGRRTRRSGGQARSPPVNARSSHQGVGHQQDAVQVPLKRGQIRQIHQIHHPRHLHRPGEVWIARNLNDCRCGALRALVILEPRPANWLRRRQ